MHKKFCVNNRSDPKSVTEAVTALKRMVRFGKRAERALKELETEGFFDGRVPVMDPCYKSYSARVVRFPAYIPISRDDIPGWKDMTIDFGELHKGSHGGHEFRQFQVFFRGTALAAETEDYTHTGKILYEPQKHGVKTSQLGYCRIKSNGSVTFAPCFCGYPNVPSVIRVKRNPEASDKTRTEALQFATMLAYVIIQCNDGYGYDREKIPQQLLDLRVALPVWLVEDGIVRRMFNEILDIVEVTKVTDA